MHLGLGYFTPENQPAGVPRHLWFLLSDPAKADRVVTGNLSTKRCSSGEVCVVAAGEHDKVTQESHLRLREVRVASVAQLAKLFGSGILQETNDASAALLLKLQQAVLSSRVVPGEAQEILRAQGVTLP